MDTDYSGDLLIDGVSIETKKRKRISIRQKWKNWVCFQFHYLLNEFSVLKNVALPGLNLGKLSQKEVEDKAYEKLKILGIEKEAYKKPNQLSGGRKNRESLLQEH